LRNDGPRPAAFGQRDWMADVVYSGISSPRYDLERAWVADARANLCRAALRLALGEPFGDSANPCWTDPFTSQPLHLDATTSPALLYSVGPDLGDQGGRDVYGSQTKNRWPDTGGDIVVKLPFKPAVQPPRPCGTARG
jgi:hypothetical protein